MGRHVVVGAGQVGGALAEKLAGRGHEVTVVTRSGSGPRRAGVSPVAANAGDAAVMRRLAEGADAIYNCVNPPYHRWQEDWPPVAASLLAAAESSGAVLVTLGNLYGYGPVDGPMTEDLPLAATGTKGRVRARMWEEMRAAHEAGRVRVTEVRGSDYYGPGSSDQSYLGPRLLEPLLGGKTATVVSDPDIPHSWTYLPDVVRALVAAAEEERAWGRPWHVPTAPPVTMRAYAEMVCEAGGVPAPRLRRLPAVLLKAGGLVVPFLRELGETRYQFDRPYVLDSSASQQVLGFAPTPVEDGVKETVAWWRSR
ncbi:NAD-dependent epimerase/dehydratase family protein [Microbispora triticiradicis]|uniref:NAD-dependent epimerase/dehydratase family protein n=1 Tax=Microbispora triticiradicis TaxID=2200763 RepID=UPI001AD614F7|nr:NAD-dependent epimerase/dehydratase family protein [Microbispora triticiradicis]MBO4271986.1 NAD-dependent epimerase/dehydratase family protein [Microbispora triticiradicis]